MKHRPLFVRIMLSPVILLFEAISTIFLALVEWDTINHHLWDFNPPFIWKHHAYLITNALLSYSTAMFVMLICAHSWPRLSTFKRVIFSDALAIADSVIFILLWSACVAEEMGVGIGILALLVPSISLIRLTVALAEARRKILGPSRIPPRAESPLCVRGGQSVNSVQ